MEKTTNRRYIRDAVTGLFIAKDRGTTPSISNAQPVLEDPRWNTLPTLMLLARILEMKDPYVYTPPTFTVE